MGLSIDITLPRNYEPIFPAKCIVCHAPPDSTLRVAHNHQNPLLVFFIPLLLVFGWSRVEVPICARCKPRFRLQRWGRQLVTALFALTAVALIAPHFRSWPRLTRKIVIGALAVAALIPWIIAETLWPRIFDTTARRDSIDYEFASREYAAEFFLLNQPHVLKSDFTD